MASFVRVVRETLLTGSLARRPSSVPMFLVPSLSPSTTRNLSTSTPCLARHRGDRSKNRGVSAMRRTGLNKRQVLSVSPSDMPKPVLDPAARSKVQVDPEHGLWGFFNPERTMFATPEWNHQHGRSWQVSELRKKHWNDLWCLWWVCVRERNRLSTEEHARHATDKNTFGQSEAEERDKEVQRTMTAIKRVLTERWYAWEDARVLAEKDPKINLNPGPGQRGHSPRDKRPQQLQTSATERAVAQA